MTDQIEAAPLRRVKAAKRPRVRKSAAPTTHDAIEIAMERVAKGEPETGPAHRVLHGHARLIGWQIASERASFGLKVLTGLVGVIAALVVAVLLYSASQYRGLTVQPFSVPPELEARGLNGATVATRLLDKLSTLQQGTVSLRAPNTYANSWGDEVEVEIPQTGVSAGELWKFLRSWLGQEVKITGEVVRLPDGRLEITARAGGQPAPVFVGTEAELDALLTQAAESIYANTQPYRYAIYLNRHGRDAESVAELERIATTGSEADRKWAYAAWSLALQNAGQFDESIEKANASIAIDPKFGLAYANRGGVYGTTGRAEESYQDGKVSTRQFRGSDELNPEMVPFFVKELRALVLEMEHDAAGAAAIYAEAAEGDVSGARGNQVSQARMLVLAHDPQTARRLRAAAIVEPEPGTIDAALALGFDTQIDVVLEDWPAAAVSVRRMLDAFPADDPLAVGLLNSNYRPYLAYILARTGDIAGAEAALQGTPLSSYYVLIAQGQVAALKGDIAASERWFARAAAAAPSLADAEQEWGRARLDRRDWAGAIPQYRAANRKAPRWADPLKGWGDALAGQGDHRAAVGKYAAAARLTPRWGKLHIAWGRSLAALGRRDEAVAKWRAAAAMDLSPVDRAAVAQLLRGASR